MKPHNARTERSPHLKMKVARIKSDSTTLNLQHDGFRLLFRLSPAHIKGNILYFLIVFFFWVTFNVNSDSLRFFELQQLAPTMQHHNTIMPYKARRYSNWCGAWCSGFETLLIINFCGSIGFAPFPKFLMILLVLVVINK